MSTSTTYDRVSTLLVDRLGVSSDEITAEATFEQLDLDSLDLVEFALGAEETFGVRISDDEAEGLRTVGDAVALLETKNAVAGQA
jgi:acyl carrier protein